MLHQTTLDYALRKITQSQRRAEVRALYRVMKAAPRGEACCVPPVPEPEACCA